MVATLVRLKILLLVALLAACAVRPPEPMPVLSAIDALPEDSPAGSLLAEARSQWMAGDTGASARLLERAISLQPDAAILYRTLAEVRLEEGAAADAEGLLLRALRYAPADPRWQARTWALIAQARDAQGRIADAAKARQNVQRLHHFHTKMPQ